METNRLVSLVELSPGDSATVVRVDGGKQLVGRLADLGVRSGKRLRKISGMPLQGPVTVQVDGSQVAIGYGMASRIFVEMGDKE